MGCRKDQGSQYYSSQALDPANPRPTPQTYQQMVSSCLLNLKEARCSSAALQLFWEVLVFTCAVSCTNLGHWFASEPTSADLLRPAALRPCLPHSCLRQPVLQGQIPGAALEIYPQLHFL